MTAPDPELTHILGHFGATLPAHVEASPLHDALSEWPTANVWRRAWLRDRIAVLSGGVR